MDLRNILFLIVVSALLIGVASAHGGVNDFKIDDSYSAAYNGTYHSLYLNEKQDSGIAIFKNANDDAFADEDDEVHDELVHEDGQDYLVVDDDYQLDKNADNTANFTDTNQAEHGIVEVVSSDGENYIVVFWAKNNSDVQDGDLMNLLDQFNKDNGVEALAF